jgi:hypothetical protein
MEIQVAAAIIHVGFITEIAVSRASPFLRLARWIVAKP